MYFNAENNLVVVTPYHMVRQLDIINLTINNVFCYSLHSNSQLDINIKGGMIKDLHNLAGFRIPDKNDVVANPNCDN